MSHYVVERYTRTEERILKLLQKYEGSWLSKAAIVRVIWGEWYVGKAGDHTLRVYMSRMRPRLRKDGWQLDTRLTYGQVRLKRVEKKDSAA